MENQSLSLLNRLNDWLKQSVMVKVFSIGFLILILLIPLSMIKSLIKEREIYNQQTTQEVYQSWGNAQTVTGPILTLPYEEEVLQNDQWVKRTQYAHFLPEMLEVNGKVVPQERYRSIYKVIVYQSDLVFSGTFKYPNLTELNLKEEQIQWNEAIISLGISDMRGIKSNIDLNWNGKEFRFNPGMDTYQIVTSGVSIKDQLIDPANQDKRYNFSFSLALNGSDHIQFVPVGKENRIHIQSDWKDPKFVGAFLPEKPQVTNTGFTAEWEVLNLNRNYPQQWKGSLRKMEESAFGVELLIPVDEYQKNMRSVKYAILIIVLTFMIFFFVEILNKRRIHPFQYILVGLALVLFYILLLSLSEHIAFNLAFLIASLSVTSMVGLYTKTIYQTTRLTIITTLALASLYGFIFVIIQVQDYALLFGGVGLFSILAMIMWLSRKINWYNTTSYQLNI